MPERFKAIVRRRDAGDDAGCDPEDVWPEEYRWVADWDRFDEAGRFISGCMSPFMSHAAALAAACAEADDVRRRNAAEAAEEARRPPQMTHATMCGAESCFVPWCSCSCHLRRGDVALAE